MCDLKDIFWPNMTPVLLLKAVLVCEATDVVIAQIPLDRKVAAAQSSFGQE